MTKDRIVCGLRGVGALLIVGGLATYSIYARHFHASFIAECRDLPEANLGDAPDGTIDIGSLYTFLIEALPLALASHAGLKVMVAMIAASDCIALLFLLEPYHGSDCGIHSGNDQDFTGEYVMFGLGYMLLVLALYVVVLVDLATRGVRWLRRSLQR
jgi:hypothetical protein